MAVLLNRKLVLNPENYANNITALDFYPKRAKFTFSVEPDEDSFFEAVLPGDFDEDSIRLLNPHEVHGNIKVERRTRSKWIPERLKDLDAQLQEQNKIIDELTPKKLALEQTLELIKKADPDKAPEGPLSYIREAQELRLKSEQELQGINAAISEAVEKRITIARYLDSMHPDSDMDYISVSGRSSRTVKFEAFTDSASWRTGYIMDLNSTSGDINFIMYIRASQKTGLDYEGAITFHTKTPDENLTSPSLAPLKVDLRPKETRPELSATYTPYEAAYETEDIDLSASESSRFQPLEYLSLVERPAVSIRETLLDTVIQVQDSITGDGREAEIPVIKDSMTLKSKPEIILIPEHRNNAWIIANMSDNNERLIPGMADIRLDGHAAGIMTLAEGQTSGGRIPFGYIELITIKKEALFGHDDSELKGLSTSGYKLEITNNTNEARKVTVRDRLPLTTDESIKLDIKRIEPQESERDSENRLTWKIEIPAHGKANITVDYTLSYPSIFRYKS